MNWLCGSICINSRLGPHVTTVRPRSGNLRLRRSMTVTTGSGSARWTGMINRARCASERERPNEMTSFWRFRNLNRVTPIPMVRRKASGRKARFIMTSDHAFEFVFGNYPDAELLCLGQFGAGILAREDVTHVLADARGHRAAVGLDKPLCFLPGVGGERSGEDEAHAGELPGRRSRGGAHGEPRLLQPLNGLPVVLLPKKEHDAFGDPRSHGGNRLQVLRRSPGQRVDGRELLDEQTRDTLSDMTNAECIQHAVERPCLAFFDPFQ